jgi:hypothetical protein
MLHFFGCNLFLIQGSRLVNFTFMGIDFFLSNFSQPTNNLHLEITWGLRLELTLKDNGNL